MPDNGYAWWYIDGVSHDGDFGITIIAFIGSVFSPYYKAARRRSFVNPEDYCAINVALYGVRGRRWAMTERSSPMLTRTRDQFTLGPSSLSYDGTNLIIDICETAFPFLAPVRGRVRVRPKTMPARSFALDEAGRHVWQPIAPMADIEVEMQSPQLSWRGHGYLDHNRGLEPIEDGFHAWEWARMQGHKRSLIHFDMQPQSGCRDHLTFAFDEKGTITPFSAPERRLLRRGFWGMSRHMRSETQPQLIRTFEDAPFYTRNMVRARIDGEEMTGVHESLSLKKFRSPIVQKMLPFRMPRAGHSRRFF